MYQRAILGGTFDHLHRGHLSLIDTAFTNAAEVYIGVTSDEMVHKKQYARWLEPFAVRKRSVLAHLERKGWLERARVEKITDAFGPSVTMPEADCIIVTRETQPNADIINRLRADRGLGALALLVADHVISEDGIHISSTRIRRGEIDRLGRVFARPEFFDLTFRMTAAAEQELKKVWGTLYPGEDADPAAAATAAWEALGADLGPVCIAVGDVVSRSMLAIGARFDLVIGDLATQRGAYVSSIDELGFDTEAHMKVTNPKSHLTPALWSAIKSALESAQPTLIEVDGEEDLAVLPAVLLAPLGSQVVYGVPSRGIAAITVDEEIKAGCRKLIGQFEPVLGNHAQAE